jgi:hypothetical protein
MVLNLFSEPISFPLDIKSGEKRVKYSRLDLLIPALWPLKSPLLQSLNAQP